VRVRSFVAVPLDAAAQRALVALERELARAAPELKWVDPELMHLTLKFLGDVAEERLPEVTSAVRAALAPFRAFDVQLSGAGAFPDPAHARVLWAGAGAGTPELASLARAVEEAVEPLGFERESREWRAHVTLSRVKTRLREPAKLQEALAAPHELPRFRVDRVHLMKSEQSPRGLSYTPLATMELMPA